MPVSLCVYRKVAALKNPIIAILVLLWRISVRV